MFIITITLDFYAQLYLIRKTMRVPLILVGKPQIDISQSTSPPKD